MPKDWSRSECTCREWHQIYKNRFAKCGEGPELWEVGTDVEAILKTDHELCKSMTGQKNKAFFPNQKHNLCVPFERVKGPTKRITGSWCYIWPGCGNPLNDWVSWKPCDDGVDPHMEDLDPDELFAEARKGNVSLADMALRAYEWAEVQDLFEPKTEQGKSDKIALAEGEQELQRVTFVRKSRSTPATITVRGQTWQIHDASNSAKCLEGCNGATTLA